MTKEITMAELESNPSLSNYNEMDEDDLGIMDEEMVNWPVLCTRIFAFFLLFLIIVCFALEEITKRFLILAAIICVVLILVIVFTYVNVYRFICCQKPPADQPSLGILHFSKDHPGGNNPIQMVDRPSLYR